MRPSARRRAGSPIPDVVRAAATRERTEELEALDVPPVDDVTRPRRRTPRPPSRSSSAGKVRFVDLGREADQRDARRASARPRCSVPRAPRSRPRRSRLCTTRSKTGARRIHHGDDLLERRRLPRPTCRAARRERCRSARRPELRSTGRCPRPRSAPVSVPREPDEVAEQVVDAPSGARGHRRLHLRVVEGGDQVAAHGLAPPDRSVADLRSRRDHDQAGLGHLVHRVGGPSRVLPLSRTPP